MSAKPKDSLAPPPIARHPCPWRRSLRLPASILAMLLMAGSLALAASTRITGSGRLVTRQLDLTGFRTIEAASFFQVEITQGEKHSVAITVDDNLVDYLNVNTSGTKLRLRLKPNVELRDATLKAVVTMPELTGLQLSGATRTRLAGFSSNQSLDVNLSGASHLGGDIKCGDARFEVSGAGWGELQGSAGKLSIHTSGASHLDLERFGSRDTDVKASGASSTTVNPTGKLEAHTSGASSVRYVGEPTSVRSHSSGASLVSQK